MLLVKVCNLPASKAVDGAYEAIPMYSIWNLRKQQRMV